MPLTLILSPFDRLRAVSGSTSLTILRECFEGRSRTAQGERKLKSPLPSGERERVPAREGVSATLSQVKKLMCIRYA